MLHVLQAGHMPPNTGIRLCNSRRLAKQENENALLPGGLMACACWPPLILQVLQADYMQLCDADRVSNPHGEHAHEVSAWGKVRLPALALHGSRAARCSTVRSPAALPQDHARVGDGEGARWRWGGRQRLCCLCSNNANCTSLQAFRIVELLPPGVWGAATVVKAE